MIPGSKAVKRLLLAGISLTALTHAAGAQDSTSVQLSNYAMQINALLNAPGTGTGQTAYTYETVSDAYPIADFSDGNASIFTDCSGWVNYALNSVSPLHQALTATWRNTTEFNENGLNESAQPYDRAFVLQSFFADSGLPVAGSSDYAQGFQQITDFRPATADNPNGLQTGDVVAYCSGTWCDGQGSPGDTGHTFIVVGTPTQVALAADAPLQPAPGTTVWAVPIVDSTLISHYDDQRPTELPADLPAGYPADQFHVGGVGYGVIYIAVDDQGRPVQTQFGPGDPFLPTLPADEDEQKLFGAVRLTDTITINDTLVASIFPDADSEGYASTAVTITGPGSLVLQAGTLELAGDSNHTGPTIVQAGAKLIVNGSIVSDLTVQQGASHGGSGTVGSLAMQPGSTVTPGNSIGTLHLTRDLSVASGATLEIEVDPTGASDRIEARGRADIAGGTVVVLRAPGVYLPGQSYRIVTAEGGVNGTFDAAETDLLFLDAVLSGTPTAVDLTFVRNAVSFASAADTPNGRAAAAGLDSVGGGPLWTGVLQATGPAGLSAAFDSLSGEIQASVKGQFLDDSRFVRAAALDRLRSAAEGGGAPGMAVAPLAGGEAGTLVAWTRAFGSWGENDGSGGSAGLDRNIGGLFVGADMLLAEAWRVGGLLGYSRTSADLDGNDSSADSSDYHIGLYGGRQFGPLGLRGGAAYTRHDVHTTRSVSLGGGSQGLSGDYTAHAGQVFAEAGWRFDLPTAKPVSVEPFANVAYAALKTEGFTEDGGAAALHSDSDVSAVAFTTLGAHGAAGFEVGGLQVTAHGTAGWRHAVGDRTPTSSLSFAGGSDFTVSGAPIAKDALVLDAGLEVALGERTALGVSYGGQFGQDSRDQSASVSLTFRF